MYSVRERNGWKCCAGGWAVQSRGCGRHQHSGSSAGQWDTGKWMGWLGYLELGAPRVHVQVVEADGLCQSARSWDALQRPHKHKVGLYE